MARIPTIMPYHLPLKAELPNNLAKWKIDPSRAILLIHDMQKYFLERIPFQYPRSELISNTAKIRNFCLQSGIPVAYTLQPGSMTDQERGLLKDFWGSGMKADPFDQQIVDELAPTTNDWLFTKWKYSAFYRSNLLKQMNESNRDQLIICGVYAHIGILATSIDAFSNNIEVFLISDAVADFSKFDHLMALNYAASCCAIVLPTNEVIT